jgi:hypothetical protein
MEERERERKKEEEILDPFFPFFKNRKDRWLQDSNAAIGVLHNLPPSSGRNINHPIS